MTNTTSTSRIRLTSSNDKIASQNYYKSENSGGKVKIKIINDTW